MARIRLIHWAARDAAAHIDVLQAAGHEVAYDAQVNPGFNRRIRETQPEAFVIDLSRLPSHGREVAVYIRGQKSMRDLPIIFVDGTEEKVTAIRDLLPDATYTKRSQLKSAVRSALKKRPTAPVIPPQMMDRYALRTTAQKLGVKEDCKIGVFEAPRGYVKVIGALPAGATLLEEPVDPCTVTVWFAHDPETFLTALPRMRRLAAKTKLWVAWKKKSAGPSSRVSEDFIRNSAIAAGLVDYKVCAIDTTWSGLALAVSRTTLQ